MDSVVGRADQPGRFRSAGRARVGGCDRRYPHLVAAREGDSRLRALLARAALPLKLNRADPYYVVEAEDALGDALARPIETMHAVVQTDGTTGDFLSPEGTRVVCANDHTLRLWDVAAGNWIGEPFSAEGVNTAALSPQGHTDEVISAAFSPDG